MRTVVLALGAALLLTGCQTTSPQVRHANNTATCEGYGFKANTDAFAACMMQMDRDDTSEARRKQQIIGEAFGEMGSSMQNRSRPVTCNTSYTPSGILGRPPVGSSTTCR